MTALSHSSFCTVLLKALLLLHVWLADCYTFDHVIGQYTPLFHYYLTDSGVCIVWLVVVNAELCLALTLLLLKVCLAAWPHSCALTAVTWLHWQVLWRLLLWSKVKWKLKIGILLGKSLIALYRNSISRFFISHASSKLVKNLKVTKEKIKKF